MDQEALVCNCGEPYAPGAQFCRKCGAQKQMVTDDTHFMIFVRKAKFIATTQTFWAVFMGTWLCFLTTLLLFTYGYMAVPMLCWTYLFVVLVLIVLAVGFRLASGEGSLTMSLSMGFFIALVLGAILGLYIYDTAAIFPMFYHNARKYTNVVSSEASAAVADAGKLTFNGQTRADVEKSAGYTAEDGMVYCVAPVTDGVQQPRIEYWAAGINCCNGAGVFTCDASHNPRAQGGVRVFDNNGWFSDSRYPYYQKARQKAEAIHMLQSVGEPMFVRWVEKNNLDYLHDYYASRAMGLVIGSLVVMLVLSALLSCGLWQPRNMVKA